ncbi:MAG: F0F1 ATP synthase subunit beta, partial [Gammaproteobacteria bacterium]|nr:F0F1 ATP synthase subunit beta [Gammaproteobacteria bacterium]
MSSRGIIRQIIGAVVDVEFDYGELPLLYHALDVVDGPVPIVLEVQQSIGDRMVRAIALGVTDGLQRGMVAVSRGTTIEVPVGEGTLGRILNVVGDSIDNQGEVLGPRKSIHRAPPAYSELEASAHILETGIKVIDLIAPLVKGGK